VCPCRLKEGSRFLDRFVTLSIFLLWRWDALAHVSPIGSYNGLEVICRDSTRVDRRDSRAAGFNSKCERTVGGGVGWPSEAISGAPLREAHLDRRLASAYKFKIVPQATWKRRSKRLSVDESERTERLARVLAHAEYVWDDRDQAREWMSNAHHELHNSTPLQAARTELGARRVEDLLGKL
jgi:putative toxin-antitoxin system antitoxin component (TIGR02293 family)